MKSSAQLPVVYALYLPTMSLQDYENRLNKPNGTHPSKQCGLAMGSFLACYLEAKVINVDERAALNQLQADREHIILLINDKKCEINFDNEKQLANVFEQLRTKLDLYRELTGAALLKTTLQCSNGDTFLHHFLTKLNITDEAELQVAISLIKQDSTLVSLKGQAGHPITLIMHKIMDAMKHDETKAKICYPQLIELLGLCKATENKVQLTHEEIPFLLKSCFTLLEQSADSRVVKLGFEAAIAAASLGMPLHQSMKGCADGQTALFAYVMELDSTQAWGVEPMRRLLSVATPEVAKLQVKVNPEAVTIERIGDREPENPSRCVYLEGQDLPSLEERVAKAGRKDLRDEVLDLEIASQFFKPSVVVNALEANEGRDGIECYQVGGLLFYSDNKLLAYNRDYIKNHPCASLTLSFLSESKLLKSLSRYREAVDGKLWVLDRQEETGYNVSPQSSRFRLYLKERNYSYWVSQTTASNKVPNNLNYLLGNGQGKKSIFDEINEVGQNPANRKKIMNYYHAYSMRPHEAITKKNALLVYLEKGQSVGLALSSLAAYITQREFAFQSSKDPRLVRFLPGQIQLTSIYKSKQGEVLLRPFGEHAQEISQVRVYDVEVIKQFKRLGFDFSTAEVTTWIGKMLSQEAFSPALLELLRCLNECGAVFPEKVNDDSCGDFIVKKLRDYTEQHVEKWFELYGFNDAQCADVVHAHKTALGILADDELTPQLYYKCFVEVFTGIQSKNTNYIELLSRWFNTLKTEEYTLGTTVYHELNGGYADAMICLDAYLNSNDYMNEKLEKGIEYYNFFFELIRGRLQLFSQKIQEAMTHEPANQNSLFRRLGKLKREVMVGGVADEIKAKIDGICLSSANNHDERVAAIQNYLAVNLAVAQAVKERSIKSKGVMTCYEKYHNGSMFAGVINLGSFLGRNLLEGVVPEDRYEVLAMLKTPDQWEREANAKAHAPSLGYLENEDSTYHAPKQDESNDPAPQPLQQEPLAVTVYPSVVQSFDERCMRYKNELSALALSLNPDDIIASLNDQIGLINESAASLSPLLPALKMMICRDTGKFTRYPCMIDQNPMAYYDLDHLLNVLEKNQAIDGVEGVLTEDRITFRSASEVFLMLSVLQAAKAQLELAAVADVGVAYRPGM